MIICAATAFGGGAWDAGGFLEKRYSLCPVMSLESTQGTFKLQITSINGLRATRMPGHHLHGSLSRTCVGNPLWGQQP